MAGKLCNGTDNVGVIKDSIACCEGAAARVAGLVPVNPHPVDSDAAISFAAGVAIKADGDGDPPCCAPAGPAAV